MQVYLLGYEYVLLQSLIEIYSDHYLFYSLDILALIMNDLFEGVVYAGIDTDRYKYPIGSGRVTFGNLKSFMKAVKAGFVEIKTPKFTKKVGNNGVEFTCSMKYMENNS